VLINQGFDFGNYLAYSLGVSRNFLIILAGVIVIFLIGAGYLLFQKQNMIRQTTSTSPSPISTPASLTASPSVPVTPSPAPILTLSLTQNAIKTNINAKNFQGLIPYMTNQVSVILQATECCGPQTPDEAVTQMSYIDEGIPSDFDQNSELVKNLKSKNPELVGKFIGVSINKEHLAAFTINSENKISEVLMSVSWKLFAF
jgi:hypothetical protein